MKYLRISVLLWSFCMILGSCGTDDGEAGGKLLPFNPSGSRGLYVMCQGNYYYHIPSSISFLDYEEGMCHDSVFVAQNGITPGHTLQGGVVNGDRIFLIAHESNVMMVCDKNTMKLLKSFPIDAPRAIKSKGKYVYVSNYSGYVTKVDADSMSIVGTVKVGPNPEEMAIQGQYLYVTNSDGLNYMAKYVNGRSVSKINLNTFQVEKTIAVGVNPTRAASDNLGNVYVIAMGDYETTLPIIQKIDARDSVSDVAQANYMTIAGNRLYAINNVTDWETFESVNEYFSIDLATGFRQTMHVEAGGKYPATIGVDLVTSRIYVTYFGEGQWGADYSGPGTLMEFDSAGRCRGSWTTGASPVQIVFK